MEHTFLIALISKLHLKLGAYVNHYQVARARNPMLQLISLKIFNIKYSIWKYNAENKNPQNPHFLGYRPIGPPFEAKGGGATLQKSSGVVRALTEIMGKFWPLC